MAYARGHIRKICTWFDIGGQVETSWFPGDGYRSIGGVGGSARTYNLNTKTAVH